MYLLEKKAVVSGLKDSLKEAKIVILTDYKGLNVEALNSLRSQLRQAKASYLVVKNTLLKRAAEDSELALINEHFKGATGIAFCSEDLVAPAKILYKFAKENSKLEIKMGVMEGKVIDLESIKTLSELPAKEVLLAHVLSTMSGVPTSFVRVLSSLVSGVVNVLNAIKKKA
ncbi:MAG: 50S ribosomal protein L10 [Deltaproteobacteria bacterium]|nr:50S ribosomal protein L10 [Deltaproteobacteria bacterium]